MAPSGPQCSQRLPTAANRQRGLIAEVRRGRRAQPTVECDCVRRPGLALDSPKLRARHRTATTPLIAVVHHRQAAGDWRAGSVPLHRASPARRRCRRRSRRATYRQRQAAHRDAAQRVADAEVAARIQDAPAATTPPAAPLAARPLALVVPRLAEQDVALRGELPAERGLHAAVGVADDELSSTMATAPSETFTPLSCARRSAQRRMRLGPAAPARERTAMPSSPQKPRGFDALGSRQTPSMTQPSAVGAAQVRRRGRRPGAESSRLSIALPDPRATTTSLSPPTLAMRRPRIWYCAPTMRNAAALSPLPSIVRVSGDAVGVEAVDRHHAGRQRRQCRRRGGSCRQIRARTGSAPASPRSARRRLRRAGTPCSRRESASDATVCTLR